MPTFSPLLTLSTHWLESLNCWARVLRDELFMNGPWEVQRIKRNGHRRVIIVAGGGSRLVCHLCFSPSFINQLRSMYQLARSAGVPVAPLLAADASPGALMRYGAMYAVLHYAEGDQPTWNCSEEVLRSIAQSVAKLHSISADGWGKRTSIQPDGFSALKRRLRASLRIIHRSKDFAPIDGISSWLEGQAEFFRGVTRFFLTHGDLQPQNLVISPGSLAYLIDLEQMSFSIPGLELSYLLSTFTRADRARREVFLSVYRQHIQPTPWQWWEQRCAFLLAAGQIEMIARRITSAQRLGAEGDSAAADRRRQRARQSWQVVHHLGRRFPEPGDPWEIVLDEFESAFHRLDVAPETRP